jgi:hypothetical protein
LDKMERCCFIYLTSKTILIAVFVMIFDVLVAVKMSILFFCIVTLRELGVRYVSERHTLHLCLAQTVGGIGMVLQIIGMCLHLHLTLLPRRPTSISWRFDTLKQL